MIVCSILSHSLSKLGYEAYFYLNQDEIAEENCENLDKPELECNGKCYLAARLQSIEKEDFSNDISPDKEEKKENSPKKTGQKKGLEFTERANFEFIHTNSIHYSKGLNYRCLENITSIHYSPNTPPPRLL